MVRTTAEIKRNMTDAFMADPTIRERYQLQEGDTFSSVFSSVSLESILFFIVAAAHHVLERIFEQHKVEVEERIAGGVVATLPWYHTQCLAYQHGDALHLNPTTARYEYPTHNEAARLVRYAAVKDRGGSIDILVSGDKEGRPEPLSNEVLTAFKRYINAVKIAGTVIHVRSLPADQLRIRATVQVDPLVLRTDGTRIRDRQRVVEDAIHAYLSGIRYGGVFNKTQLVDAIQQVEGVLDITLDDCAARTHAAADYTTIATNNYTAYSGCFISDNLSDTLHYVVSL